MLIHHEPHLAIYFGTADDKLYPAEYLACEPHTQLLDIPPYNQLKAKLHVASLYFLHQIHSTLGYRLEEHEIPPAYKKEGDYLITNTRNRGIGVMTADCLPIVMVDSDHQLAIIHAGWRGSVDGIVPQAVLTMHSTIPDLRIFFGPCARACCYEVDPSFAENIPESLRDTVLITRVGKIFFDLPLFNSLLLQKIGIRPDQINTRYNYCTLCDKRFFSHRRQGTVAGRQMTVATLL